MTCKQVTKGLWLATSYIAPSNNKNKCNVNITNLSNTTNQNVKYYKISVRCKADLNRFTEANASEVNFRTFQLHARKEMLSTVS